MEMTSGLFQAICAGVTLLILWTGTVIGAVNWISKRIKDAKTEILADFDRKYEDNSRTIKALEVLVIRHDTWLNPEFAEARQNGHQGRVHG